MNRPIPHDESDRMPEKAEGHWFREKIERGLADVAVGRTVPAERVFADLEREIRKRAAEKAK